MNRIVTRAIVLRRTDYQEADRILTVLTPDQGKLRLMARGVRKSRSKMAGGIELFSVNEISFIRGRGELATLVSSRLERHYSSLLGTIDRTMLGYGILKVINRSTEDASGGEYFELLNNTLAGLDDTRLPLEILELWFNARLLKISGHSPNLRETSQNKTAGCFDFDFDKMEFFASTNSRAGYSAHHVKFLRLSSAATHPKILGNIKESETLAGSCLELTKSILRQTIR